MESSVQQLKSLDNTLSESIVDDEVSTSETRILATDEQSSQWQQFGRKILVISQQLPKYIDKFSSQSKPIVISIISIIALIITVKLVIAVLEAINDLPFVNLGFELIGIGYVTWFVFRYLLKASARQELATKIRFIQQEIIDVQDS